MDEKRMSLSEHLEELRRRVIICIAATLVMMVAAYALYPSVFYPMLKAPLDAVGGDTTNPFVFKNPLLDLLRRTQAKEPAADAKAAPALRPNQLYFTSPVSAFMMQLKASLLIGILLALPVLVYEVWAFVSAGLHEHEKRYVRTYGPASFVLFILGGLLAYFVAIPLGLVFLVGCGIDMQPILTIDEYAPFVMWLVLGFGLVFQTPLVVLFLTKIGVVEPRMLARNRRLAILAIFIIAAVVTPPDPFTQIAMALPMMGLYELSILLSRRAFRKRQAAA